jgi:hypothetical protein
MNCAWCASPLRAGARFCGECGKPAAVSPVPPPPPASSTPPPPLPPAGSQLITQVPGLAAVQPAPVVRALPEPTDYPAEATMLAPRSESWVLTLPDGLRYAITDALVVGRAPVLLPQWPDGLLVAANHEGVSKTHVVFEVSQERLFVNDLGSTNGITVQAGGSEPYYLDAHQRLEITTEAEVALGSYRVRVARG